MIMTDTKLTDTTVTTDRVAGVYTIINFWLVKEHTAPHKALENLLKGETFSISFNT